MKIEWTRLPGPRPDRMHARAEVTHLGILVRLAYFDAGGDGADCITAVALVAGLPVAHDEARPASPQTVGRLASVLVASVAEQAVAAQD